MHKKKLVIVEAPTKAKNISQYLGSNYIVLASNGHIRDLPGKSGSVKPDEDFALIWTVVEKAAKQLKAIESALSQVDTLILATDLDREGEAISWHLLEYLREKGKLSKDLKIQRVSFNAITQATVLKALENPRPLDKNLIDAYLARLGLDYLVGYTLSPVLWRKLPGSRSAGRVQSVALRIVVDREQEISDFKPKEYWTIQGQFSNPKEPSPFPATLAYFQGKKLDKFFFAHEKEAKDCVEILKKDVYCIQSVEKKAVQRHPQAPFITSTLQQDASRQLGFSPSFTMQVAQKLYEGVDIHGDTVGLITYMRTDSPMIIPDVVDTLRKYIQDRWGKSYVPTSPRKYASNKRAQEAHEAIRPSDIFRTPASLESLLPHEQFKLYKLIWDRTMASQMVSAQYDQTTILIESRQKDHIFRATGSILKFDGFLSVYEESVEDDDLKEKVFLLPKQLSKGDALDVKEMEETGHITQPPPRYTEASLIKKLEELGIGRPGTYSRILQVLKDRNYVRVEKKRLFPEERGRVVVAFLKKFFQKYVDCGFTAQMEEQLDEVSSGEKTWKQVLRDFWDPFSSTIQDAQELKVAEVLLAIEADLMTEKETCSACEKGTLGLRIGKMGPFLACSRYPECTHIKQVSGEALSVSTEGEEVCRHPETGQEVLLKKGPYGWYVQHETHRVSLAPFFKPDGLEPEDALWLLSLPKTLGKHSVSGEEIVLGSGRYGPYLKYQGKYASIKKNAEELKHLTLPEAETFLETALIKKASSVKKKPAPKPKASKKPPTEKIQKSDPS